MKKKVYIISHSHWDREWYMSYEKHHMRLVELMDDLLEVIENDPNFDSFHLDGQTIILDDYLQVRPEKEAEVRKAIQKGKLRIGPFYILQDDFLISSESNVRNMLLGHEACKKWGTPVKLGYFPDTFGNMGQAPQLLEKAGLNAAAFGRGVKPIGFDNQVLEIENYTSQYSEMWWEGPDASKVFGLLFANWYSNGNEIPAEKEAARVFWDQKLADAEKYAATPHLLMMNGVDHQPLQKDITQAIAIANDLYEDYEFIHSNFDAYLEAVQADLPEDLATVTGELTSQETDGWYTLANTASARVYLKQWNTKVQRQLENITEPLAAIAYEVTGCYPHDQLDYAWKTLLQNHPHDSICGCSVDEVHREMITRFEKANETGRYLAEEALRQIGSAVDTTSFGEGNTPFTVFNSSGFEKRETTTIDVPIERRLFAEGIPETLYEELENLPAGSYEVIDSNGNVHSAEISKEKVRFDYDLPKDRFRIPYMERYVTVTFQPTIDKFSWKTFALQPSKDTQERSKESLFTGPRQINNGKIQVDIHDNGTLTVTDLETQQSIEEILVFEDTGDIANEYIYYQPTNEQALLSSDHKSQISIVKDSADTACVQVTTNMEIPVSADERLAKEQQMVVEFKNRQAQRSKETQPLTITTLITVEKENSRIAFETTIDNQMKDHRLRVLFPTKVTSETHEADSIYEVVTRPNKVSASWQNPTNPQHQHAFVNLHDEQKGVTVSNYGLNEYELLDSQTIALTLLRAVGEMGDWGYFPTPEAQCLGTHTFAYGLELHGEPEKRFDTYKQAYAAQIPFSSVVLKKPSQAGSLAADYQYLTIEETTFASTCLKRSKKNQLVLRGFNLSADATKRVLTKEGTTLETLNLLEEPTGEKVKEIIDPYEITTIGFTE